MVQLTIPLLGVCAASRSTTPRASSPTGSTRVRRAPSLDEARHEVGEAVEVIEGHLDRTVPRDRDHAVVSFERPQRSPVLGVDDHDRLGEVVARQALRVRRPPARVR